MADANEQPADRRSLVDSSRAFAAIAPGGEARACLCDGAATRSALLHWQVTRRHCRPGAGDPKALLEVKVCETCFAELKNRTGYVIGWDYWEAVDGLAVDLEPCHHCESRRFNTVERFFRRDPGDPASIQQLLLCHACAEKYDANLGGPFAPAGNAAADDPAAAGGDGGDAKK